jgi:hypothetical protein
MTTSVTGFDMPTYTVIHPLKDVPEQKCGEEYLGKMSMTRSVKISLFVLRGYLLLIMGMLAYHFLELAGILH